MMRRLSAPAGPLTPEPEDTARVAAVEALAARLYLNPVLPVLRNRAVEALLDGDIVGFLVKASNTNSLWLVARNLGELRARGLYEKALLQAITGTRTNLHDWPVSTIAYLFRAADPARLRAAGDPMPGSGPFTVFRGVAGVGRARRVRGFCWTLDMEQARWFARRGAALGLAAPAVWSGLIAEPNILAYVNDRQEQEILAFAEDVGMLQKVESMPPWPINPDP